MRILFDSHALVWFLDGNDRFSQTARAFIEEDGSTICVSAVTAWEIANKVRLGKWPEVATLAKTFAVTMEQYDFEPLAITIAHAELAGSMAGRHRDPFDRMLAAQSQIENVPLVTADPAFRVFGTRVLW